MGMMGMMMGMMMGVMMIGDMWGTAALLLVSFFLGLGIATSELVAPTEIWYNVGSAPI
jgi:hypothetical protein